MMKVGLTTSEKTILVPRRIAKTTNLQSVVTGYVERDYFDALMACEHLAVREYHRPEQDYIWIHSLAGVIELLQRRVPDQTVAAWKEKLGLRTAFEAREYGRNLVFKHLRN